MSVPREKIMAAAEGWLGTPYHHHAQCKGAGADCLGLVLGVFREIYGHLPEIPPLYTPDWGELKQSEKLSEPLLEAAMRHFAPCPIEKAQSGDLLLFRMQEDAPVKHAGILLAGEKFIHAYSGRGVCFATYGAWWKARLVAVFSFPDMEH